MVRAHGVAHALLALAQAAALSLLLAAGPARAQAWVPPAGAASVTFLTQVIDNTGHRLDDGSLVPDGKSADVGLYVEGDYAFTDWLSISAGIPYIFAKYRGPARVSQTCR